MRTIATLSLALALAACSAQSDQAEAQADKLENAAEQSTPEAAAVLQNRADAIREQGASGAPGDPGSSVQDAMQNAGNAQVTNWPQPVDSPSPDAQQVPIGVKKNGSPPKMDGKGS